MTFQSILCWRTPSSIPTEPVETPEFFHDLNIDQIVAAVTGKDEYDLKPFFYCQLGDIDEIAYRQQVLKDLESPGFSSGSAPLPRRCWRCAAICGRSSRLIIACIRTDGCSRPLPSTARRSGN